VEVPITFVERQRGRSKMSRAIVAEALWRITVWGATKRRNPRYGAEPRHRGEVAWLGSLGVGAMSAPWP
jgi:hypothetical protein